MSASSDFYRATKKEYIYNITAIENIPSIISNGILCYDSTRKLHHASIAMNDVQARRDKVMIPGGSRLHSYANLYFTYHNPMLYKRKDMAEDICILAVSATVLDTDNCVVSDRNAATSLARFYSATSGVACLDFEKVFLQDWNDPDPFKKRNLRQIKCAEILVPERVPFELVVGSYVVSEEVREKLMQCGFERRIVVNPRVFYR